MVNERIDRSIVQRRRGIRPNEAGRETRERILDEAEHLFARHGLDGVSVREITDAAGVNTAAIHYHFGSKHDLVAAVLARRAGPFEARRHELLDELETSGTADLRAVVRAMVLPNFELASDGPGGANYIAFLAALGNHPELVPLIAGIYDRDIERFMRMLTAVTPALPHEVRELRWAIAKDMVNRMLGQPEGQVRLWSEARRPGSTADLLPALIDVIVGMFEAEVTSRPARRQRTA